jgi:hypothetical protein
MPRGDDRVDDDVESSFADNSLAACARERTFGERGEPRRGDVDVDLTGDDTLEDGFDKNATSPMVDTFNPASGSSEKGAGTAPSLIDSNRGDDGADEVERLR